MADHDARGNPLEGSPEWHGQAPKVSDALRKGSPVKVTTWGGREVSGLVCDREPEGVLLALRATSRDEAGEQRSEGYVFFPWTSLEQVEIREVAQRRVKFLPG
jgi:hypothetical protein